MKKILLSILFLTLSIVPAFATVGDTFTSKGVKYTITSEEPKTVEVSGWNDNMEEILWLPEEVNGYSVTSIRDHAFSGCSILYAINIPTSVTSIGPFAFRDCTTMISIVIPSSVTSISDYTFYNCSDMMAIKIADSVTSIGVNVFYGCSKLTSMICLGTTPPDVSSSTFTGFIKSACTLTVPDGCADTYKNAPHWYGFHAYEELETVLPVGDTFTIDGVTYKVTSTDPKTIEVSGYTEDISPNLVLPLSANGYSVTAIGNNAFAQCKTLTSITLPHSLTSIGDLVFDGCSGLTLIKSLALTPPVASSLTFSGFVKSACKLTVPEGCVGDYKRAANWRGFKEIVEPGTDVGDTFTYKGVKYKITSVDPKMVEVSGWTDDIEEILTLPEEANGYSVTSIGMSAFRNCTTLLSIIIPSSVTSISDYSFYNCTNLGGIRIPDSVTSIGDYVFGNCSNLTYMICLAPTPPSVSASTFIGFDKSACTLALPEGCEESYKANIYWKGFKFDITTSIEVTSFDTLNVTINGREVTVTGTDNFIRVYDISGREILTSFNHTFTLPKGIAIIVISDHVYKITI